MTTETTQAATPQRLTPDEEAAIRRTLSGDIIAITASEGRALVAEVDALRFGSLVPVRADYVAYATTTTADEEPQK
jgi:hypothetical protein